MESRVVKPKSVDEGVVVWSVETAPPQPIEEYFMNVDVYIMGIYGTCWYQVWEQGVRSPSKDFNPSDSLLSIHFPL